MSRSLKKGPIHQRFSREENSRYEREWKEECC